MKPRNKGLEPSYKVKCILRLSSVAAALVSALLFSIAFFLHFEPETALFKAGSRLIYVAETLTLSLCFLIIALTFILIKKRKAEASVFPVEAEYKPYYRVEPLALKTSRYFAAILIISEGILRAFLMVSGGFKVFMSPFFTAIMILFTIPLALFFMPELVNKLTPGYEKTHLICGTLGVIWFFLNVINTYFDNTVALSSPYRIIQQLTFLLTALMLVYEIKLHTDVPFTRARLATLLAAFLLCAGFTVGRVILLLCGKAVSPDDTAIIFTFIGLTVYMGVKIFYYNED